MNVRQRVLICRLIEQMDKQPEFAMELGLEDESVFEMEKEKIVGGSKNGTEN